MVVRRKVGLVKNINVRGLNTQECKISKIRTRKQVENEESRKPKDRASFQVSVGSGDGTWYTEDGIKYIVTSSIAIKEKFVKDEVLSKIIEEVERLFAQKQKLSYHA